MKEKIVHERKGGSELEKVTEERGENGKMRIFVRDDDEEFHEEEERTGAMRQMMMIDNSQRRCQHHC